MVANVTSGFKDRPESLSGKNVNSFAYITIRDRLPDILTKVIDRFSQLASLHHSKKEFEKAEDAKDIISKFSKLKNEMQTDKEIILLNDTYEDVELWNAFISSMPILVDSDSKPTWYTVAWLSCECYLYRRIHEALQLSKHHFTFDPFFEQKSKAFYSSEKPMQTLASYLIKFVSNSPTTSEKIEGDLRLDFEMFLEYCLWGNKCDLSLSGGSQVTNQLKESAQLKQLLEHIICNNTEDIWNYVKSIQANVGSKPARIDFVLDNSGFELYTDLCLAEFLLDKGFCDVVFFHVKSFPWFVSDVTKTDFYWTIKECSSAKDSAVQEFGNRWQNRLENKSFVIVENGYWTLPYDFSTMKTHDAQLYQDLSDSHLIIFKGDLNYRKLIGDRDWPHTTTFSQALAGFCPSPLCALRTLKADLVVGLQDGQAEELSKQKSNWMVTGSYAVIQFCKELS